MPRMLSVATGFQYSVNIAYDLNRKEKLKSFIPTPSSLQLLEEILLSTVDTSIDRARILIGAYGKGKSHIVLMILSMLLLKNRKLFERMNSKIEVNSKLFQCISNYYDSKRKLLPVIISGSSTSISQAFLLALEKTLTENDLTDIMPETNFKAAIAVIDRWEKEYPDTYAKLIKSISKPIKIFKTDLLNFDISTYDEFEKIYPGLTAGSRFNPFVGFDIVELYTSVVKSLKNKGYTGIYVVYDEFSKYLETNIVKASISDTKMLQDFAEKCCRSGSEQLHIMLISHKDIANYIDKLPKQKVDGWRGISERFKHIYLNNNFYRTYEIIANVILKDKRKWNAFCNRNKKYFDYLIQQYKNHVMFCDEQETFNSTIYECYPLHPVSTYILPRLSELVAQNERTLFSFLSSNENNTLYRFLEKCDETQFSIVTPDLIYDYFEPQIKKDVYSEDIRRHYFLTKRVLEKLNDNILESKIVKTISLIYILAQFEKLKPTREEIVNIYSLNYSAAEINNAIDNLINQEYVIYLKRLNNYLCLKQTSGVNIKEETEKTIEQQLGQVSIKHILNDINVNNYMYPSKYNDEKEMTRYFIFRFIEEEEITDDINWNLKDEINDADGVIYGILVHSDENIQKLKSQLLLTSVTIDRKIFVLPKVFEEIDGIVKEYNAIITLKDKAGNDQILFDEYEVVYEDLRDVINNFINNYTQPEKYKATYIWRGREEKIAKKGALTGLMSNICKEIFDKTPIINNEAINRNKLTSNSANSCNKIVTGLLRNDLEINLGLGSGQEVSIMRSVLIRTGILVQENGFAKINLSPEDSNIKGVFSVIIDFVLKAKRKGKVNFIDLYTQLTDAAYGIGLRKGLIPIFIAAVFHEFKQEIVIYDSYGPVSINSDTLVQVNAMPQGYELEYLNWTPEKEHFVQELTDLFKRYIVEAERAVNSYDYVVLAMKRWYLGLPKYAKEARKTLEGEKIDNKYLLFIKMLKHNYSGHEFLFKELPKAFTNSDEVSKDLLKQIRIIKNYFDGFINNLKLNLIDKVKLIFSSPQNEAQLNRLSLASVIKDWCETLDQNVFDQLFSNGTEKCLTLFKNITQDESSEISKLARLTTGLRLEDWDDTVTEQFEEQLRQYKRTAEDFRMLLFENEGENESSLYQISFIGENGETITKRFEKIETSQRGKLLLNNLTADIDAMGTAISEQEKRQILMDILQSLC